MRALSILKGKTLKSVSRGKHAEDGDERYADDTITFHCEDGDYVFRADGDCCSKTYIDSVEGPTAGRIVDINEPWEPVSEKDDGERKFYRATLSIEGKGFLDVEYRNESNGNYGGSLEQLSVPETRVADKGRSEEGGG